MQNSFIAMPSLFRGRIRTALTISTFLTVLLVCHQAHARQATIPMTLEYPMVQSLLIRSAFSGPDQSSVIVDEGQGCRRVVVSRPRVDENRGLVRLQVRLSVHAGVTMFGECKMPVEWDGYLVLHQTPRLDPQTWALSFKIRDSALFEADRTPGRLSNAVWGLIRDKVHAYLEEISISLAFPRQGVRDFVVDAFPQALTSSAQAMMDSLLVSLVEIRPDSLRILASVDIPPELEREPPQPGDGSDEALADLTAEWEEWDGFLVYVLTGLAGRPLSGPDRDILLDVLLDTRYRFVAALEAPPSGPDLVRDLFVSAWRQTGPIFRAHLGDTPSDSLLGYLALFSASDALTALDAMGPALNIDISRQGLVRLAANLSEGRPLSLAYRPEVDPKLRRTLGLGPALAPMSRSGLNRTMTLLGSLLGPTPAWAGSAVSPPSGAEEAARNWIFVSPHVRDHLDRILPVLEQAAESALKEEYMPDQYHDLYRRIVRATAWQESCFRQFLLKNDRPTYIKSYNNTSVGLMQINERVWRGIYDPTSLQWDIAYNARAGCDIVSLYFRKYILRKMERMEPRPSWDDATFAGLLYAMYNGGPGQFSKYLTRRESGESYISDRLFMEKFVFVDNREMDKVSLCLVGR
ncbi:MAG: lytic transglycosylase domain-containing protein [Deltaproteobacteria bacterium]|nr:lytic transglycosylase domain-containing protein [Deltaproteobacteria bacterium]